jgi:hypothetical protein
MKPKKILVIVGAAVLIYTLLWHPSQLGDGVQTIFDWIGNGFDAIITFLKSTVD